MLGKVEEDPVWWSFNEHYLPWHGHVTALTVAPQSRRLGLAQGLTKALERGCEQQNAWFVDLFVREGNKTAIDLYEGLGSVLPLLNRHNPASPDSADSIVRAGTPYTGAWSTIIAITLWQRKIAKTLLTCGNHLVETRRNSMSERTAGTLGSIRKTSTMVDSHTNVPDQETDQTHSPLGVPSTDRVSTDC